MSLWRRSAPKLVPSTVRPRSILDHLVAMRGRRREAQPLGAARHGGIVDRLDIDAVLASAARRSPILHSAASPTSTGTIWLAAVHHRQARLAQHRSSGARRVPAALALDVALFQCRMEASAPAAIAGASEVVKMKPGAKERMQSTISALAAM